MGWLECLGQRQPLAFSFLAFSHSDVGVSTLSPQHLDVRLTQSSPASNEEPSSKTTLPEASTSLIGGASRSGG